jgi:hypothetical protein
MSGRQLVTLGPLMAEALERNTTLRQVNFPREIRANENLVSAMQNMIRSNTTIQELSLPLEL